MSRPPPPRALYPSPEDVEHAFYEAMARADLQAMMALWCDEEEPVCIHPGGARLTGLSAIRASFAEIFSGGGLRIRPTSVQAVQRADMATHSVIEEIAVSGRMGTETVQVMATNVYVRSADGWALLVHHATTADTAPPPGSPDPERPSGLLH